jgi:TolA-binding protein
MMNEMIHIKVLFKGHCPRCKRYNEEVIYDYGLKPYEVVEKEMDSVKHYIHDISCKRCATTYSPKSLVYRESVTGDVIIERPIDYDGQTDPDEMDLKMKAHENRFEYFRQHETEFWDGFTAHALQNWRDSINELRPEELLAGLAGLNMTTNARTVNQLRRDILNRGMSIDQKIKFWYAANHDYVYDQLLEIGPMGWYVEGDVKQFGQLRTRYVVLNYPMEEAHERLRTDMIGKVVRKDRGDNAFLFKRIAQLSDELYRLSGNLRDKHHQLQEMRAEIEDKNKKIHELHQALKNERENKNIISRDPDDIRKIQELKSLINELILAQGEPEKEERQEEVVLEEAPIDFERSDSATEERRNLEGKMIGIIGGQRAKQAKEITECRILTHTGYTQDPEFESLLKESDELVILTQFVSHAAMWTAKAHAIDQNKSIHYTKAINLYRILDDIKKTPVTH